MNNDTLNAVPETEPMNTEGSALQGENEQDRSSESEAEQRAEENTDSAVGTGNTEDSEVDTDDESDDTDTGADTKNKNKGFKKRIDRFEKKIEQRDRIIEELVKRLGSNTEQEIRQPAPVLDRKPVFADYNDIEAYTDAVTDWKLRQTLRDVEAKQTVQSVQANYNRKLEGFVKNTPDFHSVMEDFQEDYGNVQMPEIVQFVMESDIGPEITYHLAKNTDVLDRIMALPAHRRFAELGKIEDRISAKTETKTKVKVEPEKKVSKAAAPLDTTVKGTGKINAKSIYDDDIPYAEWIKMREKR